MTLICFSVKVGKISLYQSIILTVFILAILNHIMQHFLKELYSVMEDAQLDFWLNVQCFVIL